MELKPTRIVQLQAENVKKIRVVEITPQGSLVVIGGDNAEGKSSVLDSIAMAIGGKDEAPAQPVRRGAKKARIILDLGDIIVQRTFTAAGGTGLKVTNKDGASYASPQAILDSLTTRVTFDPLAFLLQKPPQQAATIRALSGVDFAPLDAERKKAFDERTNVSRDADSARARLAKLPNYPDAPDEPVTSGAVLKDLNAAMARNAANADIRKAVANEERGLRDAQTYLDNTDVEIRDIEDQLAELRTTRAKAADVLRNQVTRLDDAKKAAAAARDVDLAPFQGQLANAENTNAQVRANQAWEAAAKETRALDGTVAKLTRAIEAVDEKKAALLESAKLPVAGLSFTDDGVTFNGLPLDQASQAEQLRVSVAIAAALNPKLRVMMVRDGSLLDDRSLRLLAKLAEEQNLQVWVERVGHGAECSVVMEDGAVQGAEPPAETAGEGGDA